MRIKLTGLTLLVLLTAIGATTHGASAPLQAKEAWVRWLPGDLPAGGYITLVNSGDRPVSLVGVSSADYGSVMLHRTLTQGGVSQMTPVEQILLPPHTSLSFQASGYHLMLMHPTRPIHPGDQVTLTLRFSDATSLPVSFSVRAPDGSAAK